MPNVIGIFDTESTGFIRKNLLADNKSQATMVSICALLYEDTELVDKYATIVRIHPHSSHPEALKVHGITDRQANDEGVSRSEAFENVYDLFIKADALCGHNIKFDLAILKLLGEHCAADLQDEEYLLATEDLLDLPSYCTMESSTDFCKLPKKRGKGYKAPKLSDLYTILFNEELSNYHSSETDAEATARCFFELRKLGVM